MPASFDGPIDLLIGCVLSSLLALRPSGSSYLVCLSLFECLPLVFCVHLDCPVVLCVSEFFWVFYDLIFLSWYCHFSGR